MPWCEMCKDYHLRSRECLYGETWLSEREKEVLALIAKGMSNKFIAGKLHLSVNTIRVYLKNLYVAFDIDGTKYDKRLKLALLGQEQKEIGHEIHQKLAS